MREILFCKRVVGCMHQNGCVCKSMNVRTYVNDKKKLHGGRCKVRRRPIKPGMMMIDGSTELRIP